MKSVVFLILFSCIVCCFAESSEETKIENTVNDKGTGQKKPADNDISEKDTVIELKVGSDAGNIASKGLPQNIQISFDENTFDSKGTLSVYSISKDLEIESYKVLTPIWVIECDSKFKKKAKYTFEYEKEADMPDATIVVLTYWNGNWILSGIPKVDSQKGTVTIEANFKGWFVAVRPKSRDEIRIRKYTFADGDKRNLLIVGCFSYDTVCRKDDDLLEEKIEYVEHFTGDVTFCRIERNKRTGIKVLYAESISKPDILYFQSKLTLTEKKETLYSTAYEIPKQRGVISAQIKDNKLAFDGMPTIILLKALMGDKEVYLPTMRGNLNLSGIFFDWKWQEMFHIKNFTYKTEMTMPHGTSGEQTHLVVYLQFIVR